MVSQSARVTILGDEYPIRGDVDGETTQRVAEYVNETVAQVRGKSASADKLKLAVLSALNIAGELFEYRSRNETSEQQLRDAERRAGALADRIEEALTR
jgi:cell division protein ZapA